MLSDSNHAAQVAGAVERMQPSLASEPEDHVAERADPLVLEARPGAAAPEVVETEPAGEEDGSGGAGPEVGALSPTARQADPLLRLAMTQQTLGRVVPRLSPSLSS
jgi:hypothetical protein